MKALKHIIHKIFHAFGKNKLSKHKDIRQEDAESKNPYFNLLN
jgi:hypothetical protein